VLQRQVVAETFVRHASAARFQAPPARTLQEEVGGFCMKDTPLDLGALAEQQRAVRERLEQHRGRQGTSATQGNKASSSCASTSSSSTSSLSAARKTVPKTGVAAAEGEGGGGGAKARGHGGKEVVGAWGSSYVGSLTEAELSKVMAGATSQVDLGW
jgi:hypothetical protein